MFAPQYVQELHAESERMEPGGHWQKSEDVVPVFGVDFMDGHLVHNASPALLQ
jgi:hypothetical protein